MDFASHARQSGQKWTSLHPWPWNAPGVDYPVGYYTPTSLLKDPTRAALPAGCRYLPTGSILGGPIVTCQSVASLTVSGFDFSLHGCIPLDIKNSVTGAIKITDNRFVNGPNCSRTDAVAVGAISGPILTVSSVISGAIVNSPSETLQGGRVVVDSSRVKFSGSGAGGVGTYGLSRSWADRGPTTYIFGRTQNYLVTVESGGTPYVDFENNYLDGQGPAFPISLDALAALKTAGALTINYNVFLHCPCRPAVGGSRGPILIEYNYFEDFVYNPTDGHGEVMTNVPVSGAIISKQQYSYNVCLLGKGLLQPGGTACYWLGGGAPTSTYVSSQVDHSIGIANLVKGRYTIAGAVSEIQTSTYTSVILSDNYSDPTGALFTFYASHSTCTHRTSFAGNKLLTSGASVDAFQANSGNGC